MARIEDDDVSDFLFGSLIVLTVSTVSFILYILFLTPSGMKSNREVSSKSNAVVLLHQGNYTSVHYTNKNTIKLSNDNRCIDFTDNKTKIPISACTHFTIKAN